MRLFFLLIILLAFDLYAFQAVRSFAHSWQPLTRNIIYTLYWLIPAGLIVWLVINTLGWDEQMSKTTHTVVRTVLFITYISKLLVVGILLVDDLRRLVTFTYHQIAGDAALRPGRSRFMAQLGLLLGGIPFVSLLYGMIRNPYRYRVFKEKVKINNLPASLEGLKIVQISDLHTGSFLLKEPVKNAVELINSQQPDLVFFTGDLVNSKASEAAPFVDIFDKVKAKYGVYSVLGNHDYGDYARWESESDKQNNMADLEATHKKMGWQLLRNSNEILEINGEKVAVIGVENYSAHPRFPKYGDLNKASQGVDGAAVKLLLSHDPSHWEDQIIKDFKDIALTFSGHTHGMQFGVEIPGWFKWSPIKYVYKQWAGLYQKEEQYLYVNRGLGYLGYPGRVGILPEVTLVELSRG